MAAAIATVRASNAAEFVKLALEFLVPAVAPWGEDTRYTMGRDGHVGPRVDRSGLGGRVKTGQYVQLDILAVMTSAAL